MSELDKLEKYLKEHGYEYTRNDIKETPLTIERHQVIVYDNGERTWDAVCQPGSYGYEEGLLEIMGDIVWYDIDGDSVRGWLTADDVIARIERGAEGAWNDALRAAVNYMPAADAEPRWIPVTERLPEEDYETGNGVQFSADVLATIVNHANDGELYVWLLKTVDGKWYDYIPNEDGSQEVPYGCEVIAWMPLPTPYKGGEGE